MDKPDNREILRLLSNHSLDVMYFSTVCTVPPVSIDRHTKSSPTQSSSSQLHCAFPPHHLFQRALPPLFQASGSGFPASVPRPRSLKKHAWGIAAQAEHYADHTHRPGWLGIPVFTVHRVRRGHDQKSEPCQLCIMTWTRGTG